ncbi:MAG: GMC family oxidoreductase N-terminal domain-containing protein [Streptosporangiaceae bacterium]
MEFDYVIVGAGSAGCVIANRLSAQPGISVAVLEAGGTDRKQEIRIPAAFPKVFKTAFDWNYATTKQAGLGNRELYWPRGKVLGGSSCINAMMWVRGVREDYDGWEVPGWSYDEVLPYFKKAEKRVGSNKGGVYGTEGVLHIEEQRSPNVTTLAFLKACEERGLTRLDELNGPSNEGYSMTPVTQKRGRRWSAHDAYLKPVMARKNLTVLTNAQVERVVVEDGRASGVQYGSQTVTARKEVILSAGTIGSPQLLMLSGIGEAAHLAEHGIPLVHELAGVGQHLEDHLSVAVLRQCPQKVTLSSAERPLNVLRYLLWRTGPFTTNVGEAVVFLRSDPNLPAPDLELVFAPGPFVNHGLDKPTGEGVTVGVVLLQPDSVGSVRLASKNPADPPKLDAAYLTGESDLARLRFGMREAEKLLATDALKPYVGECYSPYPGGEDEDVLERYIRENSETLYHPVGTCRMGVDDASVVDPCLRVRGIEGLRVADASIMPRINRGHTHAPAIMIGEKASDLIASTVSS